jgi:Enoyl-CoA hydratase/isomerase
VPFDSAGADEQFRGYLAVAASVPGQPDDVLLLRRELAVGVNLAFADLLAGGEQLPARALGEGAGTDRVEQVVGGAQLMAGVEPAVLATESLPVEQVSAASRCEPEAMAASAQFTVDEVSPSYWRVTFENGPVNLLDADSIEQLARLVSRIEESATVTVLVFDSVNPDYFMAHWDLKADRARVASMAPGPTGLHSYLDNLVRLSKVPAVTISAIRGRVRGAGSEFVLATDIRFAATRRSSAIRR